MKVMKIFLVATLRKVNTGEINFIYYTQYIKTQCVFYT